MIITHSLKLTTHNLVFTPITISSFRVIVKTLQKITAGATFTKVVSNILPSAIYKSSIIDV